jgi:hypothetical protein
VTTAQDVLAGRAVWSVEVADAVDFLRRLPDGCLDAVLCDPPYPEISRQYGRLTEAEWHTLMHALVPEARRALKPSGSAMFVLQPNSRKVGSMRPWLWEFMAWSCREWNMVQDVWWWNPTSPPTVHCHRTKGLMRPSVKACVWLGAPDCYRCQEAVLWTESARMATECRTDRVLHRRPSGQSFRAGRIAQAADERGGVTPFNLLPISNTDSTDCAGANGHGAGTPLDLCSWWVRYVVPPDGLVCDPFVGSGTMGIAARQLGRRFVGCDKEAEYVDMAQRRIGSATPLLDWPVSPVLPVPLVPGLFDSLEVTE